MKILFVCLGNICRSPMAEGIMKELALQHNLPWHIESAGTQSYHIGNAPHPCSQEVCKEHGIDISNQRAQKFKKEHLQKFDLVYALSLDVLHEMERIIGSGSEVSKLQLFLNELYPNANKSVTDPWYGGKEGYYPVFEEIKAGCQAIFEKYQ